MPSSSLSSARVPPEPAWLAGCDVVWQSRSEDSAGSMPLGNGELGVNLWVEPKGDVVCYLARTDAWSEHGRLLKLGRLRLSISPNPFAGPDFQQALRLAAGEVEITARGARLRAWVDAHAPVLHYELESDQPVALTARLELWRTAPRVLSSEEAHSAYTMAGSPNLVVVQPDTIVDDDRDRLCWYHRNQGSCWEETLRHQGFGTVIEQFRDPIRERTFGGWIAGDGLARQDATTLASSEPRRQWHLRVVTHTSQAAAPKLWLEELAELTERAREPAEARQAHRAWWRSFWQRSWIFVRERRGHQTQVAEVVTQGYALQRYLNACAGRGSFPIKFNGSLFTVDGELRSWRYDADYRRWGDPYWFQNTRLIYWPMLAAGDLDLMRPLFAMYRAALPLAEARTRLYFGHDGAFFPETMTFWGCYANHNYGWNRQGRHVSEVENRYIRWHYNGGLELLALMLEYQAQVRDEEFVRETLLPLARGVLRFYAEHFGTAEGRLVIEPASALETWHDVRDPLPDLAGLRVVLDRLLACPCASAEDRAGWAPLRAALPPLPMAAEEGRQWLRPAAEVRGSSWNAENPELYAVFPYRLYGVGRPDLEIGRETFARRRVARTGCWMQDPIQAALLGLAESAKEGVVSNFATSHGGSRFPAFWGPNHDWVPDQDHGGVAMMALQSMLLQPVAEKLYLLPAWPREWDVSFRLHAPGVVVEADYRDGAFTRIELDPPERAGDLVLPEG